MRQRRLPQAVREWLASLDGAEVVYVWRRSGEAGCRFIRIGPAEEKA